MIDCGFSTWVAEFRIQFQFAVDDTELVNNVHGESVYWDNVKYVILHTLCIMVHIINAFTCADAPLHAGLDHAGWLHAILCQLWCECSPALSMFLSISHVCHAACIPSGHLFNKRSIRHNLLSPLVVHRWVHANTPKGDRACYSSTAEADVFHAM